MMTGSTTLGGEAGTHWLAQLDRFESMIEPVSEALLVQAAYAIGEKGVDVGCAVGWATRQIAEAVGNTGFALGLDISPELAADTAGATGDILYTEVSGDTLIVDFGEGYSLRGIAGFRVRF